jgi:ABC-2 type transport system permease protein
VFFTFLFPVLLVLVFGVVVQTGGTGGGLFALPPAYYVPGYLAVVVLFTPLSRIGSEVARHREGARFEKLATTPLSRAEWLLAQTLVNAGVIGLAALLILVLVVLTTGADVPLGASTLLVVPYVLLGVVLFCGLGAVLGRVADSQDGVIAASNGVALPLLFLSETFVQPDLLPGWLPVWASPLTYFSRGVRAVTYGTAGGSPTANLAVLTVLAAVLFAAGALAIPRTD